MARYLRHPLLSVPLILTLLSTVTPATAQPLLLDETFNTGGFTSDYHWSGDLSAFTFPDSVEDHGHLLRLNAAEGSTMTQIRTPVTTDYGSWEFRFRQDFAASSVNRAFIFLWADRPDLDFSSGSGVNGYAIRTGESGNQKRIRLIRFDNGMQHEVLSSRHTVQPGDSWRVRVTRSLDNEWQLFTSSGTDRPLEPDSEVITDPTYTGSGYFGVLIRHSASNRRGFMMSRIHVSSITAPFRADTLQIHDDSSIDVHFNRPPDPVTIHPDNFISDGAGPPSEAMQISEKVVRLRWREPLAGGWIRLWVNGISDHQGNKIDGDGALRMLMTVPAEPGDLVINEILYDPAPSSGERPAQSEYVEIYNRRTQAVSMDGFRLNRPGQAGSSTFLKPSKAEEDQVWIAAKGYLLVYPESEPLAFEESRTAAAFQTGPAHAFQTARLERQTIGLPLAGGAIELTGPDGMVSDRVDYDPDWHNPELIHSRGISLERVSPDQPSHDPANWGSSAHELGGTPGSENTLYLSKRSSPDQTGLTLWPNPFSPDGDGHDDHLSIRYRLPHSDYQVRVRIFDRYGRHITTLGETRPSASEGELIWGGRGQNGQFVRIGIYILILDASHSATGPDLSFRETFVVARRFSSHMQNLLPVEKDLFRQPLPEYNLDVLFRFGRDLHADKLGCDGQ